MKRISLIVIVLGLMCAVAAANGGPSVLARLEPLQRGNLPWIFTVYGEVGPNSSARDTLMAPLQTEVGDIFVRPGQLVAKGTKLLELRPSPSSTSAYMKARSALDLADNLVRRTRSLVASHLATDQQLAQAEQNQLDARANFAALRAQGAAGVHDVTAPFAAIVTKLAATPGAIVPEGGPLIELARPNGLIVKAGVVPSEATMVRIGDQVALTPLGGGKALHGQVLFVGSVVEVSNGLVPVDVSVPSRAALLGEMFRADIVVGKIHGYVVPHHAVLVDDIGAPYVVQSNKMIAKKVKVRVVGSFKDDDVVSGPLDPRMPLVVAGAYQMDNGTHIRVEPSRVATDPKGK